MAAIDSNWEDFPSYFDLLHDFSQFIKKIYRDTFAEKRESQEIEPTWQYFNFSNFDLLLLLLLSIGWTVFRLVLTVWIFKPVGRHYALTPANQRKMPESAWKFVCFLGFWCCSCYVVILSGNYKFFQKPSTVWEGWNLDASPQMDIYLMYMMQCSFYLHCLYSTLFVDTWRKDSFLMMVHHVSTLLLISISYSLRYHNIGSLTMFLHDISDVFLEFGKLNIYFKIQNGKLVQKFEILANINFVCFTISWFIFRMYLYPLKVLHSATSEALRVQELFLPFALQTSLLWILQLLHIYWSLLIVQLLFRVATGQVDEICDTREYDDEGKVSNEAHLDRSTTETVLYNGVAVSHEASAASNRTVPESIRKRAKKHKK